MGGSERPKGRKATKRTLKEMTNSTVVDLVTTQLKALSNSNSEMSKMLQDLIGATKEDKAQKMIIREQNMRP